MRAPKIDKRATKNVASVGDGGYCLLIGAAVAPMTEGKKMPTYQIITTKGRKSADTLEALAAWLLEMQPSSTRIVHGDVEAEVEWEDETCEQDLQWALRLEEAAALDLTIRNDRIYLVDGGADSESVYVARFGDGVCIVDYDCQRRVIRDGETLADLAAAVAAEA